MITVAPPILPVYLEAVKINEIARLQEAFLSSSGRGIVPIVEIDGIKIGNGEPGTYTKHLRESYEDWSAAHLEEI